MRRRPPITIDRANLNRTTRRPPTSTTVTNPETTIEQQAQEIAELKQRLARLEEALSVNGSGSSLRVAIHGDLEVEALNVLQDATLEDVTIHRDLSVARDVNITRDLEVQQDITAGNRIRAGENILANNNIHAVNIVTAKGETLSPYGAKVIGTISSPTGTLPHKLKTAE